MLTNKIPLEKVVWQGEQPPCKTYSAMLDSVFRIRIGNERNEIYRCFFESKTITGQNIWLMGLKICNLHNLLHSSQVGFVKKWKPYESDFKITPNVLQHSYVNAFKIVTFFLNMLFLSEIVHACVCVVQYSTPSSFIKTYNRLSLLTVTNILLQGPL